MSTVATPRRVRMQKEAAMEVIEASRERIRQKAVEAQMEPDYLFGAVNAPKQPIKIDIEKVLKEDVQIKEVPPTAVVRKKNDSSTPFLEGIFVGAIFVLVSVVIAAGIMLTM